VQSGAQLQISGQGGGPYGDSLDIAVQSGSTGKVSVDNASLSATSIAVGGTSSSNGGTGLLSITNGGGVFASGTVTVQSAGTVQVESNSTLAANGGVTVNAGGTLGGGGTIYGDVTNSGVVAPGAPQTTTIGGDYTEMSNGNRLRFSQIDPHSRGAYPEIIPYFALFLRRQS
jgi:hypothetical protein